MRPKQNRMVMLVGFWVLLVSACFHPNYDHPACGPNLECPSPLVCRQLICEEEGGTTRDATADASLVARTRAGLIGLWEFGETSGTTIADTCDVTPKVPLTVTVGAATFSGGTMTPTGASVIASTVSPHLNADVMKSNAVTLEAWVMPSLVDQGTVAAPVVVAGLSPSTASRNISILQAGKRWLARVRTTADTNGGPDLLSTTDITANVMTHLVVVSDATQRILYVDGKANVIDPAPTTPLNWDVAYKMTLGNEPVQGRQWAGTFALVAIYKQALSSALVTMNHAAGPSGQ